MSARSQQASSSARRSPRRSGWRSVRPICGRTLQGAPWPPRQSRGRRAIPARQARSRPGRKGRPTDPSCSGGATGRVRKRSGSDRLRLPCRPARRYSEIPHRPRYPLSLCRSCVTRSCQRSSCNRWFATLAAWQRDRRCIFCQTTGDPNQSSDRCTVPQLGAS